MNFGSADVNLSLASTLKTKQREVDHSTDTIEPPTEDVIDLGGLLKEKSSIFQWISEEKPPIEEKQSAIHNLMLIISIDCLLIAFFFASRYHTKYKGKYI